MGLFSRKCRNCPSCVRVHCRDDAWETQSPANSIPTRMTLSLRWPRTSRYSFWITVTTGSTNSLRAGSRKSVKNWPLTWIFNLINVVRENGDCAHPLGLAFRVVFQKPTLVACYDPFQKIWSSFEPFKHFCRHFVSTRFLIVIKYVLLNNIITHLPMFQPNATIWWAVHQLQSTTIIWTVKRGSWRMKALTRCPFVPGLERGEFRSRFVFHCSSCHQITWARNRESLPSAFWTFPLVSVKPSTNLTQNLIAQRCSRLQHWGSHCVNYVECCTVLWRRVGLVKTTFRRQAPPPSSTQKDSAKKQC
jgi:hypothetical protein